MFRLEFLNVFSPREGNYTTLAGALDAGVDAGFACKVTCHGVIVASYDPIGGIIRPKDSVVLYAEREACDDVPLGLYPTLDDAYLHCVAQEEANDWEWLEGYNIVAVKLNGDAYLLEADSWCPTTL